MFLRSRPYTFVLLSLLTLFGCGKSTPLQTSGGGSTLSYSAAIFANSVPGTITKNNPTDSTTLTWNSQGATNCTVSSDNSSEAIFVTGLNGSYQLPNSIPTVTTTYSIVCHNDGAADTVGHVKVVVPPSLMISANGMQDNYPKGTTDVTIAWTATGVTSCSVAPLSLTGLSNSAVVKNGDITANTVYTLTCLAAGQTFIRTVTVTVGAAPTTPTVSITANNAAGMFTKTNPLDNINIVWSSTGTAGCAVTPFNGTGTSGNYTVPNQGPTVTTTYTLTCNVTGAQPISASVQVVIPTTSPSPSVQIVANDTPTLYVKNNVDVVVKWTSVGVQNCTVMPTNVTAPNGSITLTLATITATTDYTVTCTVAGGANITSKVTVKVPCVTTSTQKTYSGLKAATMDPSLWFNSSVQHDGTASAQVLASLPMSKNDTVTLVSSSGISIGRIYPNGTDNFSNNGNCPIQWALYFRRADGSLVTASTAVPSLLSSYTTGVKVPEDGLSVYIGFTESAGSYFDNEGIRTTAGGGTNGCTYTFQLDHTVCN